MKYKICLVILMVMMLLSAVPVQEVKAALDRDFPQYSLTEVLDICGISYPDTLTYVGQFIVFRDNKKGDYYFVFFDKVASLSDFLGGSANYLRLNSTSSSIEYISYRVYASYMELETDHIYLSNYNVSTRDVSLGSTSVTLEYTNINSSKINFNLINTEPYHEEFLSHTHSYISKETPATCTESGRSWEQCTCGDIQNEMVVPALGHTWTSKEEDATCTKDGRTYDECSVCSAIQNEVIIPTSGHGSTVYEVTQQPTLEEEGIFVETCSVCGEVVKTGTVPMLTPTPAPTLPPSPELVSQVTDFFLMYVTIMTLFQSFPLNLFVVACLLCVAVVLFHRSYKKVKSGK